MLNRSGIIGLCCTAANKEPSKPIIDAIAKHLEKTGSHKMLVFQCFEDMHMNTPTDIGGASVYKLINYYVDLSRKLWDIKHELLDNGGVLRARDGRERS